MKGKSLPNSNWLLDIIEWMDDFGVTSLSLNRGVIILLEGDDGGLK